MLSRLGKKLNYHYYSKRRFHLPLKLQVHLIQVWKTDTVVYTYTTCWRSQNTQIVFVSILLKDGEKVISVKRKLVFQ